MPPKIVVIGGGSYNWAPTIINDVLVTPGLEGSHIVLEDVVSGPMEVIQKLGEKMIAEKGSSCTLSSTTDEAEALEGADFVIVTISTGGLTAMEKDLSIPAKYGVNQTVGDTVGPGGLARALRSIPVLVGIARNMEKQCPDAWLMNITNPMSTLCLAIARETNIKTIGLCHELIGVLDIVKKMLGLSENVSMDMEVAGVNHFIWLLRLTIDGRDGFEMLREWKRNPTSFEVADEGFKLMFAPSLIDRAKLKLELLDQYGCLPAAGDRHLVEFFDCYLKDVNEMEAKYEVKQTPIEERRDSWFAAIRRYVEGMLDETFPLPAKKSSEPISDIMAALINKAAPLTDIVNLQNDGQVANLPKGSVVETLGNVTAGAVEKRAPISLPPGIRDLVLPHAQNQFLVVKAALEGERSAARDMLGRDPLCRNCSDIDKMLDELLAAHAEYLPRFA